MESDVGLFQALFFTSLTVNLCSWLHFGLFALVDKLVAPEAENRVSRLRLAHKHNAAFMRNFYLDAVLFTILPIATVVLTFTSRALVSPFNASYPQQLRVLFSVVCGVFIFMLFRVCLAAKNSPIKYMNIIIHLVSVATSATVLLTGEDATIGLILAVSTGDIVFLNLGKLMEVVVRVTDERYLRLVTFLSAYACIIFRAFLPLACISISLVNDKPFSMSYPSIFFFFVGILFFGAINTWQVNVTLSRLCRRKRETVVEVPYRQFGGNDGEPKPEDIAVASSSIDIPPSYNEVCGDSSYLPAFLSVPSSSMSNDTAPSLGAGNELLTLNACALSELADSQNSSMEQTSETFSDTAALV